MSTTVDKKKKGTKRQREEEVPPTVVCHERRDMAALGHIHELVLPHEVDNAVKEMWAEHKDTPPKYKTTRQCVAYGPSKDFKEGRLYARSPSMQSTPGWVRRIIGHKYYHDIDMANAFPSIFSQIVHKAGLGMTDDYRIIEQYASERATVFQMAREQQSAPITDEVLKELFLIALHNGYKGSNPIVKDFAMAVLMTAHQLSDKKQEHMNIYSAICQDPKKTNKIGTFVSHICQAVECKALLAMHEFFKNSGYTVGTLVFDGLMVERKEPEDDTALPADLLREAEKYIFDQTQFVIKLAEKPMKPTEDDWKKFNGPKDLMKIETACGQQIELMIRIALREKLARSESHVYSSHPRVPGVYLRGEEAKDFINRALSAHPVFRGADMKQLEAWFDSNDHPHFPLITPGKIGNAIAFQNGYMDIDEPKFHADEAPPLATKHFFDRKLDLESLGAKTPLWDSLLSAQLGARSTCSVCSTVAMLQHEDKLFCNNCAPDDCDTPCIMSQCDLFEVLIGRLFYPVGKHDQWQVMPFLKGDANTGKSTVIKLVSKMFPAGSVGSITANLEGGFGLESLFAKRLVTIPDLPENFAKVLKQSDFQSILSGETVSIARKNKTAVNELEWTVPMIGAGNYLPDYKDSSGSISRRLAVFLFVNLVQDKNTLLDQAVIDSELVTVMLRCIYSYRSACARLTGKEFWSHVAPRDIIETQESVKEETNHLANFIQNGSPYYQISHESGAITKWEDLEKAYCNHMRIDHKIEKQRIGSDLFPIKNAGFTIARDNLCKTCHGRHLKEICGEHYDGRNRYRRVTIHGMKITCNNDIAILPQLLK